MIKEKIELNGFGGRKLPIFKGHCKITLHNCRNGKNEVIEGDNIVTNAVRDLFARNYLGAVDYSKLMPLWSKWFGGILVFEQAHTLNADNYFCKPDNENHLFAHAGNAAIDAEHDDDLTRGNPVTPAFTFSDNAVKQVWEWGTTRANVPDGRYIRSLALTHSDTGNAGLGLNTYAFQNYEPLEIINGSALGVARSEIPNDDNIYAKYDDNRGICFMIGDAGEYTSDHAVFETNKITVQVKRFPFRKTGLYDLYDVPSLAGSASLFVTRTITTGITFYCNPAFYFDQTNKRLWLFSNITGTNQAFSKNTIYYTIIDLSDLSNVTEYAHGTIISDANDLAPVSLFKNTIGIFNDGSYWYFPTGSNGSYEGAPYIDCTGYKKINVTNNADQSVLSFGSHQIKFTSPIGSAGMLFSNGGTQGDTNGRVMNGSSGFVCKNPLTSWAGSYGGSRETSSIVYATPNEISSFAMCIGNGAQYHTIPRYIVANKLVNTTLFNLPTPVQKTSSQSMTIEYTISEVSGNE